MTTVANRPRTMLAEFQGWSDRRWRVAVGIAVLVLAGLVAASGIVTFTNGVPGFPGSWWIYTVTVVGAGAIGLVVASYIEAPIGAEATLCDVRWPGVSLIALYLATDLRTAAPILGDMARPAVAVAALAVLTWALIERLGRERRAVARRAQQDTACLTSDATGDVDTGAECSTCRPLFPRRPSPGGTAVNDGPEHTAP
ncbi:MAG: hypothetical protein ACYCZY_06235 [Lacisediminihabitans sp.]